MSIQTTLTMAGNAQSDVGAAEDAPAETVEQLADEGRCTIRTTSGDRCEMSALALGKCRTHLTTHEFRRMAGGADSGSDGGGDEGDGRPDWKTPEDKRWCDRAERDTPGRPRDPDPRRCPSAEERPGVPVYIRQRDALLKGWGYEFTHEELENGAYLTVEERQY
jgi:hypothetical protein